MYITISYLDREVIRFGLFLDFFGHFLCNMIYEMYIKSKMLLQYEVITSKILKAINQASQN